MQTLIFQGSTKNLEIENQNFVVISAEDVKIPCLPVQCPCCSGRELYRLEFL